MLFEPIYPSVRFYCAFCGQETDKGKLLTVRVRDMALSGERAEAVFCEQHREKYAELCNAIEGWKALQRANFEKFLAEETPKAAKRLEREIMGTGGENAAVGSPPRGAAESSAPAPRQRGKTRKLPGEIPQPENLQAN